MELSNAERVQRCNTRTVVQPLQTRNPAQHHVALEAAAQRRFPLRATAHLVHRLRARRLPGGLVLVGHGLEARQRGVVQGVGCLGRRVQRPVHLVDEVNVQVVVHVLRGQNRTKDWFQ